MAVNPEQWFDDFHYFGQWPVDYFEAPALLRFFDHVTGDQHDAGERPKLLHVADHKSWPWNYRSDVDFIRPVVRYKDQFWRVVDVRWDDSRPQGTEQRYLVTLVPCSESDYLDLGDE